MRANVFTDASLERYAGQFAWLALDTEKARNNEARTKLAPEALPSLFVLDAATEKVVMRWVGGATAPQLAKMLDEARGKWAATRKPRGGTKSPKGPPPPATGKAARADEALARADAAYGEGKYENAAKAYREAIEAAPKGWPAYARAVESNLFAYDRNGDVAAGLALARLAWPKLKRSSSAANVAASGLGAALSLPQDEATRQAAIAEFETACREVVTDRSIPVAADDRSGVWMALAEARKSAGDEAGRKKVLEDWLAFLEAEWSAAPTPTARTVYDSHILSAAIQLSAPERAIPFLEAAEKAFPDDYNPPARLAGAYESMKKWDEALAANDRALARVYGPRKLNVWDTRFRVLVAKGDQEAAKEVLAEQLRYVETLPKEQRSDSRIAAIRQKMVELSVPPSASSAAEPAR